MSAHIIITGNPVDGHGFIGLFATSEDAVDWATENDLEPDWWVAPMEVAS